jgi:osmotically-inducible protein OsmY
MHSMSFVLTKQGDVRINSHRLIVNQGKGSAAAGVVDQCVSKTSFVTDSSAAARDEQQSGCILDRVENVRKTQEQVMNVSSKKRILIMCAYFGAAVSALGGFADPASAQTAVSPPAGASASIAVSAIPATAASADRELASRVKDALHADPYFYDEHVSVSVADGAVVLHGFVFSDWDLRDAIRIAKAVAGDRRVIDDLTIQEGGRR